MPDIIDTAAEIEELQRNAPFPLTASTVTQYLLSNAWNAEEISHHRGVQLFPTTRRVPVAG